jgi:hypothetical protein
MVIDFQVALLLSTMAWRGFGAMGAVNGYSGRVPCRARRHRSSTTAAKPVNGRTIGPLPGP